MEGGGDKGQGTGTQAYHVNGPNQLDPGGTRHSWGWVSPVHVELFPLLLVGEAACVWCAGCPAMPRCHALTMCLGFVQQSTHSTGVPSVVEQCI